MSCGPRDWVFWHQESMLRRFEGPGSSSQGSFRRDCPFPFPNQAIYFAHSREQLTGRLETHVGACPGFSDVVTASACFHSRWPLDVLTVSGCFFPSLFAPISWAWKTVFGLDASRNPCKIDTDMCKLNQEVVRTRWAHSRRAYSIQMVCSGCFSCRIF